MALHRINSRPRHDTPFYLTHSQPPSLARAKRNLARTGAKDVIIVCVAGALSTVRRRPIQDFKRKVDELKNK